MGSVQSTCWYYFKKLAYKLDTDGDDDDDDPDEYKRWIDYMSYRVI